MCHCGSRSRFVRSAWQGFGTRAFGADLCQPKVSGKVISRAEAHGAWLKARNSGPKVSLGYGVIGNTTVSGTVILGSSPGIPALFGRRLTAANQWFRPVRRFETDAECMKYSLSKPAWRRLEVKTSWKYAAPSYSGLVRCPLTAVTRVRIPLGSPTNGPGHPPGAVSLCWSPLCG